MIRACGGCGEKFEMRSSANHFCSEMCKFNSHFSKPASGCWDWKGLINCNGYGMFTFCGLRILAHRFAYEKYVKPIPAGLFVLHKCDRPVCVNPDHLFAGTAKDNSADCIAKGRNKNPPVMRGMQNNLVKHPELRPMGERHHSSKLTVSDIKKIAKLKGNGVLIAKQFGISRSLVSQIRTAKIWKHVLNPTLVGKATR